MLLLSFWQEYRVQSLLQVLTDLAWSRLVIYATGGIDSSFNFLYPLVIIVACILLPRSWAFLTAALAFILYGTVLELTYFEVVPSYSTTHPGLKSLQAIILVNLVRFPWRSPIWPDCWPPNCARWMSDSSTPAARWKICRPCTRTSFSPSAAG